jgi:hypothetical protein
VFVGSSSMNFGGNTDWYVVNDLFFDNVGSDLHAVAGTNYRVLQVNVETLTGTIPSMAEGLTNLADPGFVGAATGNFRLRVSSPLRDAGTSSFTFGIDDLDGRPRVNGPRVDVGAYETQEALLSDDFETW